MSVEIIHGNLFDTDAKIICHQVNCRGVMGGGVAKQVKDRFPHVFGAYKHLCMTTPTEKLLGTVQFVSVSPEGYGDGRIGDGHQVIANIFGQDDFGYSGKCYTDLEALQIGFRNIYNATFRKNNFWNATIALPYKIGCDRGGADWEIVSDLIERSFPNRTVLLYKLTS